MMSFRVNSVRAEKDLKRRAILRLDKSATVLLMCWEAQKIQASFPHPNEIDECRNDPRKY